jgi:hypothetical protein
MEEYLQEFHPALVCLSGKRLGGLVHYVFISLTHTWQGNDGRPLWEADKGFRIGTYLSKYAKPIVFIFQHHRISSLGKTTWLTTQYISI